MEYDVVEGWGWGDPEWNEPSDETIGSGEDYELGDWLDLDVTIIEGDEDNGRFILKIGTTTIFDITNNTHHDDDVRLDGFHHIMPQKLYTRNEVVDDF